MVPDNDNDKIIVYKITRVNNPMEFWGDKEGKDVGREGRTDRHTSRERERERGGGGGVRKRIGDGKC